MGVRATQGKKGKAPGPLFALASHMWTAERVTLSGSDTAQFNPVVGSVALVAPSLQPAPTATFGANNRLAVPVTAKASGDYRGTIPAIGLNCSFVWAGRINATDMSPFSANVAGANTGPAVFTSATAIIGRRGNTGLIDATSGGKSFPLDAIIVFSVTASGTAIYVNAKTPTTATGAGADYNAATQVSLGAFDYSNVFAMSGEQALLAIAPSALNATQAGAVLDFYGAYYGIAIGA